MFSQNTRSLRPTNAFAFRGRKLRKRAFRSLLWRTTILDPHFRSIFASSAAFGTPFGANSRTLENGNFITALPVANNNEFWRKAGGLEDVNWASAPPWAVPAGGQPASVVIRGGRLWCSFSLFSDIVDNVRVRVQLCFIKSQLSNNAGNLNSNTALEWIQGVLGSPHRIGWNVMDAPDAAQYIYRPIMDRTFILKSQDQQELYWKIKPVKVDTASFLRGTGWFPVWFVYVSSGGGDEVQDAVQFQYGHNLSFSAGTVA